MIKVQNNIGVVHGRFQPFHNDHLTYVTSAFNLCDFLFIGITNPDPFVTQTNENDLKRSKLSSNPFTFYERAEMIKNALLDLKIDPNLFLIVPFPINFPERLRFYTPPTATYFITIYDDWGRYKKKELEKLGYSVNVLWDKEEKSI